MKALVLAGGKGTRLRPITYGYAKQLIPVANKPILFYVLDDIAKAGIKKVGIVVGKTKELIKKAVGDGSNWGIKVTYIEQKKPLGLAHAVKISQNFIGKESFVMYLGDNLIRGGIKSFVNEYGNNGEDIKILLSEVEHPEQYGIAILDKYGEVKQLVEKPSEFLSNKALVGIYLFNNKIFQAVNTIKPSPRGELEITDAIQYVIDYGGKVKSDMIEGWWKDTGKKEDVLEANRLLLENIKTDIDLGIDNNSKICGQVVVEKSTIIKDSVIQGPVVIGDNCIIKGSYIGPYTSIGPSVRIKNSEIEMSIVMNGTQITDIKKRIFSSLIGREVNIKKNQKRAEVKELLLGDRSSIFL